MYIMVGDTDDHTDGETGRTLTSRRTTLSALGAGAVALAGCTEEATAQLDLDAVGPAPFQVGDSTGGELDPDDLVFDLTPELPAYVNAGEITGGDEGAADQYLKEHGTTSLLNSHRAVVDPEGNPQTWQEYSEEFYPDTVEATVQQADDADASRVTLEFEGMYPNAYYTVWVVHHVMWHRPLAGNDGANNSVVTDEAGNGSVDVVNEPAELTLPPGATVDDGTSMAPVTDDELDGESIDPIPVTDRPLHELDTSPPPVRTDDRFAFVVAYHYDNRFWGSQPGPFFLSHVMLV